MPSRPRRTSKASPRRPASPKAPAPGSKRAASKRPARSKPSVTRPTTDERSRQRALAVAQAGLSKKAEDVLLLDVRGLSSVADFFVLLSGTGPRQVNALAEAVEDELRKQGVKLLGSEGQASGTWVLLDFGDVVAHIFEPETRATYDLEGAWADAPRERIEG
jgi:ribosome-associated protein